ncbi:MAG: DUF6702 family protein [Bacteroidales bacterium]
MSGFPQIRWQLQLLLLLVVLPAGNLLAHEFYVSLSEVRYNQESRTFELSIRMFPDDLDRVFFVEHGVRTELASSREAATADSLLARYLRDQVHFHCDGKELDLIYLGKEGEGDAIWCYLESLPVDMPTEIILRNTVLMDHFPDQVNMVQVYIGNWNKGLLLKGNQREGTLHPPR